MKRVLFILIVLLVIPHIEWNFYYPFLVRGEFLNAIKITFAFFGVCSALSFAYVFLSSLNDKKGFIIDKSNNKEILVILSNNSLYLREKGKKGTHLVNQEEFLNNNLKLFSDLKNGWSVAC